MFNFLIRNVFQKQAAADFGKHFLMCGLILFLLTFDILGQTIRNPELSIDSRQRGNVMIDPVTHALQFSISLGEYPGRGGNLPVVINYSSKVWSLAQPTTIDRTPTVPNEGPYNYRYPGYYALNSASGWTSTLDWVRFPSSASRERYDISGNPTYANPYSGQLQQMAARIYVQLPDGSKREMRRDDGVYNATSNHCTSSSGAWSEGCGIILTSYSPDLPGVYYSVDGSRMRYDTATKTLWLPDGSRYVFTGTESAPQAFTYYDKNGNILNYNYGLNLWTDTMGRTFQPPLPNQNQVGTWYGMTPRDDVYQVPSLGSSTQTYTFRWRYLRNPDTGETVLSNPNQQLLPIGDRVSSQNCQLTPSLFKSNTDCWVGGEGNDTEMITDDPFNPIVLSEIELPNGNKYQFRYNIYGEIDKIIYPTGAYERFEYGVKAPLSPQPFDSIYTQVNRGVTKRWISPNGTGNDEILWKYYNTSKGVFYPTYTYEVGSVTETPDGSKVESWWNQGGGPLGINGQPRKIRFGFENPLAGKVYDERVYDTNNQLRRRVLTKWAVDGTTSTFETNGFIYKTRNPRPVQSVATVIEGNQALASMAETVYDTNADPQYFAELNPKQSKAYNYIALDLSTAQNGDIDTIAGMFSENELVSVSENDYLYDAGYKARNILGLPTEVRTLNPTNLTDVLAKSQFLYDEQSQYYSMNDIGSTVGYEAPTGNYAYLRGNATTLRTFVKETNTWIETHTQYDNFGNTRKVWDSSGDSSRFIETEYSSQYYYAYPTKRIVPAPDPTGTHGTTESSSVSATYDFWTGTPLTVTDANGQVTSIEYDDLLRPKKITPPAGGAITEKEYGDTPGNLYVKVRQQVDTQNWAESTSFMDNLGRVYKTQTKDLQGDVFAEVEYDNFGRIERVSNPYRQGEQKFWSKPRYDNANRVVETFAPAPDGQTGASLGTVEFGISTVPGFIGNYREATDASGRKARSLTNVFGQTVRVDEPTGNNDLGPLDNPNQPSYYTYNVKGELIKIQQGQQKRYFMYDSLGRLIRVRQPEQDVNSGLNTTGNPENNQWTAGYTYDVFGNVISVTDAKGTVITNDYDKAGRVIKTTYSDGTPQVDYYYDGTGLAQAPQFAKGSLTKISNGISETRYTSFDNYGRMLTSEQITDGQSYPFQYKYDSTGNLIEETYPSLRVVKTHLAADGGLSAVSSKTVNSPYKTYVSNFDYTATGNVKAMMLGNGRWETAVFNSRQQLEQIGLGNSATDTSLWKVNYEYGELEDDGDVDMDKNIGNIAKQTITLPTATFVQTYKYDAVNRLVEAKEHAGTITGAENWKQTFGYDRYGNRTSRYQKVGSVVLPIDNKTLPQVDADKNRFTTGQGYVYDFNGNLIQDAENHGFTFDGNDKQTVVRDLTIPTSPTNPDANVIGRYYYDGEGKRVKKVTNTETTVFVYDAAGALVAEYSTQTATNPTTSYLTTDHLGSPRVITDKSGNVISRRDFMPFGEEILAEVGARDSQNLKYSASGADNIRQRFTGYEKDLETELDFAQARMYQNKHGRFTAPDPLMASASLDNPQTFNRYIYVGNNPTNLTDPLGLKWCAKGRTYTVRDACLSDEKDADGRVVTVDKVGPEWAKGGAKVGDVIRLKPDNTIKILDPANQQDAAEIAEKLGGTIQAESNPVEATTGDVSTSSIASRPLDALPPCPSEICGSSNTYTPPLPNEAPPLKSVEGIARAAEGCAMIPGLSAPCGIIAAAVRAGQGDVAGAGGNLIEIIPFGKVLTKVNKSSGALNLVDDVAEKLNCFVAGTLVHTEKGLVPIEEIKAGDKVLSYNEDSGQLEYQEVARLFRNTADEFLKIQIEGEAEMIQVTLGHPFYVRRTRSNLSADADDDGDWILSKSLKVGDLLKSKTGAWKPILSIEKVAETQATYNFEVAKNHDYFVGQIGWLVHNQSQKLLNGIVNTAFTGAEDAAYRTISGRVGNITKGIGKETLEDLTLDQRMLAARKYLNKAFQPKGSLPSKGVTNFQIDRANFMLNGGKPPGKLNDYLKRNGY